MIREDKCPRRASPWDPRARTVVPDRGSVGSPASTPAAHCLRFLTMTWIYSVALTVKAVVREKETRLRCTMHAMGLSGAVLWLGWFLSCLGPFSAPRCSCWCSMWAHPGLPGSRMGARVRGRVTGRGRLAGLRVPGRIRALLPAAFVSLQLGDILPYSHAVVLFLFLAAFKVATVVQSFLLSAFFSRANLVAACEGLAYFVLYLPYVLCVAWLDQLPVGGRVAAVRAGSGGVRGCEAPSAALAFYPPTYLPQPAEPSVARGLRLRLREPGTAGGAGRGCAVAQRGHWAYSRYLQPGLGLGSSAARRCALWPRHSVPGGRVPRWAVRGAQAQGRLG